MSLIRRAEPADYPSIFSVLEDAFGQPDEARLAETLRTSGDVITELVAEEEGVVIAEIMISQMRLPVRTLGLGPVGVLKQRHGEGFGSALVRAAVQEVGTENWGAIFLLGSPVYYSRFGFSAEKAAPFDVA